VIYSKDWKLSSAGTIFPWTACAPAPLTRRKKLGSSSKNKLADVLVFDDIEEYYPVALLKKYAVHTAGDIRLIIHDHVSLHVIG